MTRVHFADPVESDLIKVPAFRKLLIRELENRDLAGSMEWRVDRGLSYKLSDHSMGTHSWEWHDAQASG